MDKQYADTVRLLLNVAPDVFANDIFALKGGTAINLFVRDMPRLSVDLDAVYTPLEVPREEALTAIGAQLAEIAMRLERRGLRVRTIAANGVGDTKLLITSEELLVKLEVNTVFRGTVLPVERRPLTASTASKFSAELTLPVLAPEELYGSKLVAALDRQHPRDLFDVWQMYEAGGLSDATVECCVTYLAGHNRPTHEVLFPTRKDIAAEFHASFVGMPTLPVELEVLLGAGERLFTELPKRLTERQRKFLVGLAAAEPDWSLLQCRHAQQLPALQWKLVNLLKFKQLRPADFERQAATLASRLRR